MPPNGSIEPTGVMGTVLIKSCFVTRRTPVSPVVTLTSISSAPATLVVLSLEAIKLFLIAILNVLVLPPVDPSKSKLDSSTSPDNVNVVDVANLFDLSAIPFNLPVTSPVTDPIKLDEYTLLNLVSSDPMLYCSVTDGSILFPIVLTPATEKSPPTFKLCAIPAPPNV